MAKLENLTVMTRIQYVFVIIPFATYKQVGDIGILTVFGAPVFKRVGSAWSLLGIVRHAS